MLRGHLRKGGDKMKKFSVFLLGVIFLLMMAINVQAIPVSNVNGQWIALTGGATNVSGIGHRTKFGGGHFAVRQAKTGCSMKALRHSISRPPILHSARHLTHFNSPIRSGTGADTATFN